MELNDLVGDHELGGVDFGVLPPDRAKYEYEDANTMTFVLDGRAYCVTEDPSDGYRSSMREIAEAPVESVKNTFKPVRVVARMKASDPGYVDDVLQLVDAENGQVILEAGTRNTDDYYPWFVADFHPNRMACNEQVK